MAGPYDSFGSCPLLRHRKRVVVPLNLEEDRSPIPGNFSNGAGMNRVLRTVAVVGAWLIIVISVATVVAYSIVARCNCSYCGIWDCLQLAFRFR
jgi:hypothetical protein